MEQNHRQGAGVGLAYGPTLDKHVIGQRLRALLTAGQLFDADLESRLDRLDRRYRVYASTCPAPLWAPGLVFTGEIVNQAEQYLPLAEVASGLVRFCRIAGVGPHDAELLPFLDAAGWLPVLGWTGYPAASANPARLLRPLLDDPELRCRFLFSLFLPRQHGNGFRRYPEQMRVLAGWLAARRAGGRLHCLDAACGTGEGAWDLAAMLVAAGIPDDRFFVTGCTLGSLELFAAAHAFFPHDRCRQDGYRAEIAPLLHAGIAGRMQFCQADLRSVSEREPCGVILCNGLLGGPMLHDEKEVGSVVRVLAERLEPGGIFMAADRFHAGWHKRFPRRQLEELLAGSGLQIVDGGEGVAGIRT